jgi:protein ImuB
MSEPLRSFQPAVALEPVRTPSPSDRTTETTAGPPRRYLALWLPFLPAERHRGRSAARGERPPVRRERDERPLALVSKDKGALRLAALDRQAALLPLRVGMALANARAIVPDLAVAEMDERADNDLLLRIAAACERFTPLVALDGPAGLLLDITGCAHLLGGEEHLRRAAQRLLFRFGLSSQATIAGTPDAARALARFTGGGIIAAGQDEAAARMLPVQALECGSETATALARAGLRSLNDLAERPAAAIAARFGAELMAKLQRTLGREDIRITPLRALPAMVAERHFPEPLADMDSLLGVLLRLAGDIAGMLERNAEGGRSFEAAFFRADGAVRRIAVETGAPLREPRALIRLLTLKMESLRDPIDPGFGFDAVRLAVGRAEGMAQRQRRLDEGKDGADGEATTAELVGRLVARLGRENVLRFVMRDTHDPVRASGIMPWLGDAAIVPLPSILPDHPPARPLTLFDPPQPIEALAEVPDGPPLRFRWRRVLHEVARAEGPERIAPEWWRSGARGSAMRDYYRLEDAQGRRFWIFREGHYEDDAARPRWFVQGLFA